MADVVCELDLGRLKVQAARVRGGTRLQVISMGGRSLVGSADLASALRRLRTGTRRRSRGASAACRAAVGLAEELRDELRG